MKSPASPACAGSARERKGGGKGKRGNAGHATAPDKKTLGSAAL